MIISILEIRGKFDFKYYANQGLLRPLHFRVIPTMYAAYYFGFESS